MSEISGNTEFADELKSISPERLIRETEKDTVSDFFLVLGVFYNDLKSLTFHVIEINKKITALGQGVTPERGEYSGMKSHLERLILATIYEFLEFLNKNKSTFKKTEFSLIYNDLNQDLKNRWDIFVQIATGHPPKDGSDWSNVLFFIRNKLAFHYNQNAKELRNGFVEFFFNDPKNISNESAYYSIGESMRKTRFYYCDAAIQRSVTSEINKKMSIQEFSMIFDKVVDDINFTIMDLMKLYIKQRPYQ